MKPTPYNFEKKNIKISYHTSHTQSHTTLVAELTESLNKKESLQWTLFATTVK